MSKIARIRIKVNKDYTRYRVHNEDRVIFSRFMSNAIPLSLKPGNYLLYLEYDGLPYDPIHVFYGKMVLYKLTDCGEKIILEKEMRY